jgi:hypothetical protein
VEKAKRLGGKRLELGMIASLPDLDQLCERRFVDEVRAQKMHDREGGCRRGEASRAVRGAARPLERGSGAGLERPVHLAAALGGSSRRLGLRHRARLAVSLSRPSRNQEGCRGSRLQTPGFR